MTDPWIFARNKYRRDEIMTMQDIADHIGASYWYVRALACGSEKSAYPFPDPVTKYGRSPIWAKEDINQWVYMRDGIRKGWYNKDGSPKRSKKGK